MSQRASANSEGAAAAWPVVGGLLQRRCACGKNTAGGGDCNECSRRSGQLQRKSTGALEEPARVPDSVHEVLGSPGRPLDAGTRAFMESRFGRDFSQVRVHTDEKAARSAHAVNALAYTVGRNVVFGAGQYAPQTHEGRKLIAHELTHTVQQSFSHHLHGASLTVSPANDAGEREAEQSASRLEAATAAPRPSMTQPRLQRRPPPSSDPIHDPLIEKYRRERGLPLSGFDEFGRPVGPTAAQIKYGRVREVCPRVGTSGSREDLKAAICFEEPIPGTPPGCDFREEQEKNLRAAKDEAAARVKRAAARVGSGSDGRAYADELAQRLFLFDIPSVERVVEVLGKVGPLLSGDKARFAGRTCADQTCRKGATVAYVSGAGQLPIYICPLAFAAPAKLHEIVLHEALHWTGIDVDPATPEFYCTDVDCMTPCAGQDVADAWMHYLSCLGRPPETRRSFVPKILESVDELP